MPQRDPDRSAAPPGASGAHQGTAFVLGGGGDLGASEVGMLRALVERGILPDLVVGSSVGAINGAALAAEPTLGTVRRLEAAWGRLGHERVFDSPLRVARTLVRERSHLQSDAPLRRLIEDLLPRATFEQLAPPVRLSAAAQASSA
jgi:NTE family protein